MTDPIQIFLDWFDAQGAHVRGHVALVAVAMLPKQETNPAESIRDILRSEELLREWLTTEQNAAVHHRALGKLLFVRAVVSFLIFRWGHDEGRDANQALRARMAAHFERVAGEETEFTQLVRGTADQYRQEAAEWSAAQSWRALRNTSLSDEALECWL